jgi:CMP-N-acetylneuraminic acid synthetase
MTADVSIGVCSFGRAASERCVNKLLRPFGETTLTDIVLDKLHDLGPDVFFAGYDEAFRAKAEAHAVPFVRRDERSVSIDEPIVEILSFLRDVPYTHLAMVNACQPFLTVETIRHFVAQAATGGHQPAFAVIRRNTHFVSIDGRPLNFPGSLKTINTKTVEPVLEFAHALYFFERDYLFRHGRYWDWQDVQLLEIPDRYEAIDIDTEEDFALADALWRSGHRPSSP